MAAPFFVFELDSGDVTVVPDLDSAAVSIEPYDVAMAEVVAADGQVFRPVASGSRTELVPDGDPDRSALEERLRTYAGDRGLSVPDYADIVAALATALAKPGARTGT